MTFYAKEIHDNYHPELNNFQDVTLAGRLMSSRVMGKASFAELMDTSGRIQLYINRDEICPGEDKTLYNVVFKKLLDLGDFISVKGSRIQDPGGRNLGARDRAEAAGEGPAAAAGGENPRRMRLPAKP